MQFICFGVWLPIAVRIDTRYSGQFPVLLASHAAASPSVGMLPAAQIITKRCPRSTTWQEARATDWGFLGVASRATPACVSLPQPQQMIFLALFDID